MQRPIWTGIGFLCTSLAQAVFLVVRGPVRRSRRPPARHDHRDPGRALAYAPRWRSPARCRSILLAMMAVGVGGAFVGTAPGAVVGDVMDGRGGRVVAVFQMSSDLGAILGPIAAGLLADHVSFSAALLACAAVLLVACAAAWRMPETLATDAPALS